MSGNYDVVVVGSGPAGSLAALVLAAQGKKVALLDKNRFPRPKVCGDCLNPECWDIWERHGLVAGFEALPHSHATGVSLECNGQQIYRHAFATTGREERMVEREILDQWLVQEAEKRGAVFFQETRVIGISKENVLQTNQGDFKAELILGADGRNSMVARLKGLASSRLTCSRVAWQATLELEDTGDDIHLNVFDEGYYGLARLDDKTANLCMVLHKKTAATPQKVANRFLPHLPALVWRSVYPVSRPPSRLGVDRVWLAGDAARVVEPYTGEGIYFALASGELAARQMLAALASGNHGQALAGYQAGHQRLYAKRIRVNRLARWCVIRPRRGVALLKFLRHFPSLLSRLVGHVNRQRPPVAP